jgi:hypothetical protein
MMSLIPVRIRSLDAGEDLEKQWASWQAKASATDSAENKVVIVFAAAVLLFVVLNGLALLR